MPYLDYPRCTLTIKNSLDENFLSMWILNLNIRPFNRFRIHFELFDNLFVSPRPALIAVNWLKYSNDCSFLVLNEPFRIRSWNECEEEMSSKEDWVRRLNESNKIIRFLSLLSKWRIANMLDSCLSVKDSPRLSLRVVFKILKDTKLRKFQCYWIASWSW